MQRPVTERLTAAGFSEWIRVSQYAESFGVGLGVKMSSNGNLTWSVQHTFDDIYERVLCQFSRSTTSLTVTKTAHGLSEDDWVKIEGSPIWDADYAVASITDQNNFVVTVANSGVTAGSGWVKTARIFEHEDLSGETASADGNYEFPPAACRLIVTSWTAGYVDLTVVSAGK